MLVVAYALAGTVLIDFEKEPLGKFALRLIVNTFTWVHVKRGFHKRNSHCETPSMYKKVAIFTLFSE